MKEVKRKKSARARRKTSISLKRYYSSVFARKKLSKSLKKYYSNPAVRKKIAEERREYWQSNPKIHRRYTDLSRKVHSSPSYRKKMSSIKKKQYKENKELVAKIDRAMTLWWREHPHVKKKRSEQIKNLFIKNPNKFKKFLKYGNNPSLPHFKTKQKFLVRSRGEQKIANFLFDNKIPSQYESKTLIFKEEGQICVPDFYLPRFRMYIEFYGGFPSAWKKKVMKNKLYKTHNIPCIFITPTELRDLNNYLLEELERK